MKNPKTNKNMQLAWFPHMKMSKLNHETKKEFEYLQSDANTSILQGYIKLLWFVTSLCDHKIILMNPNCDSSVMCLEMIYESHFHNIYYRIYYIVSLYII